MSITYTPGQKALLELIDSHKIRLETENITTANNVINIKDLTQPLQSPLYHIQPYELTQQKSA